MKDVKDVVYTEDESKYQRRRPVRKASKKMLQGHNPELVSIVLQGFQKELRWVPLTLFNGPFPL